MILRWLCGVVMTALLVALLAAMVIVGTAPGSAWLLRQVSELVPGDLAVSNVRGSLATGLEADELVYTLEDVRISLRGFALRFRPVALLRKRIDVVALEAERVAVVTAPARNGPREPFVMPEISLPVGLTIRRLRIGELQLAAGDFVDTVRDIELAGELEGSQLVVRSFHAAARGADLRLTGNATLVPELPLRADATWRLAQPALSGTGEIGGGLAELTFSQTITAAPGTGVVSGTVAVTGTVRDVTGQPALEATADLQTVQVPVAGLGAVSVPDGRVDFSGTVDAWRASVAARIRPDEWPELEAAAALEGGGRRIHIQELRLTGEPGQVTATGQLDLDTGPGLQLEVTATGIRPAALRPGLDGRLAVRASVRATLPDAVELEFRDLRGELMGKPVAGRGSLAYRDGAISVHDMQLRAGANELRLAGKMDQRLTGRFEITAPELGVLWPDLRGAIEGSGTLAGTRERPVLQAELTGVALALGTESLERLSLNARIDGGGALDVALRAQGLASGERSFGDLAVTARGALSEHDLEVSFSGGIAELALQSRGGWDGRSLRQAIGAADIRAGPLGEWRLQEPLSLQWRAGALRVAGHCWAQGAATLCLNDSAWSTESAVLEAELRNLSLEPFSVWLGEGLRITGTAAGNLKLRRDAAGLSGEFIWTQDATTFYYTADEEPITFGVPTVAIRAQATPALVTAAAEIAGDAGMTLRATGTLSEPMGNARQMEGRVDGELPDIAPLIALFTPDWDLADVAGRVRLDATLSGTPAAPRVRGRLTLAGGAFALPDTGVKIDQIEIIVVGDDTATVKLQGTARSGGLLNLDGEFDLMKEPEPAGFIRIRGENVDVLSIPDRYVQISPDVTLRYAAGRLTVEGVVAVPRADIVVRELPTTAVSPSADTVVHDRPGPEETGAAGPAIGGSLQINFGREVRLRGFGLDTRLTGGLKLSQTPEGYAAGDGVVRLAEGKFGAYGKELTIDRGALIFSGPLDNPGFDVRASRRVDYEGKVITAGLLLSGTAKRPESRVFSDPAMGEADALSYLISGRPLASASASDRSAIGGAALALGLQQASPLTQQLGSAVELDELGVEGSTLDETEIIAGKQLNSDLYVRFAYGLFNRIGTVLARYRLGRGLSIEAASGEDQSLDLIWSVEKE